MGTPTREEFHLIGGGKIVFYILVVIALSIMAAQIVARVKKWQSGRPMGGNREGFKAWLPTPAALKRWWSNVCTYILAQRKVRTSRRKSGAPMHLFIFFGFLSLLLATTILAINSYGPVKFHKGAFYLVYEATFDALGLLFVIGCAWALGRRYLQDRRDLGQAEMGEDDAFASQRIDRRRRPLSSSWRDYATLWLLLLIGLTGYLVEGARISNIPKDWDNVSFVGSMLAKALPNVSDGLYIGIWWFHAILVLTFFAVLPSMRIRHILFAVSTAAGHEEKPMGRLVPISMEEVEQTEKIGVSHTSDFSRWTLMSLDACMECGRCTEVCPAWNVGKVLNPKAIVQDMKSAMNDGVAIAERISDEALWACTTCNACVEACPVLIRHVDMIVDVRRNKVAEGQLAGTGAVMLRQIGSTGHAWGQSVHEREKWMEGLDIPLARDGQSFEYLFWVGCAGATDPGAMKTTKAVAALLKKAGISFACLGKEEACTGDPARRIGEEFLFQDKASQNVGVFQKYGVKKVVTACPHCFNSLKNEYGDFGAQMEVFHHTQLLSDLVRKGDLVAAKPERGKVALHDPCYLGRVNNEADAPRALLGESAGLNNLPHVPEPGSTNLAEPEHYGRKTLCCGAGGGRMWMEEPPNQRPSNRRAEELVSTGAETVALACPFCRIMLDASIKQVTDKEIRLLDLAEMLQEANDA
jgi:Fe-S oxidoreductase